MTPDPLTLKLQALSDPTRRAILARLRRGETGVNELAKPFAMSLPAISKHLKVLQQAGLITRSRAAQSRPCKLAEGGLNEVAMWMQEYHQMWEQRLDRLETYLQNLKETEK
jgi:DNA-binding transcriptional ArsR family regulator